MAAAVTGKINDRSFRRRYTLFELAYILGTEAANSDNDWLIYINMFIPISWVSERMLAQRGVGTVKFVFNVLRKIQWQILKTALSDVTNS